MTAAAIAAISLHELALQDGASEQAPAELAH